MVTLALKPDRFADEHLVARHVGVGEVDLVVAVAGWGGEGGGGGEEGDEGELHVVFVVDVWIVKGRMGAWRVGRWVF